MPPDLEPHQLWILDIVRPVRRTCDSHWRKGWGCAILARWAVATQTKTRIAATTVCGRSGSPISSHDQTTDISGWAN